MKKLKHLFIILLLTLSYPLYSQIEFSGVVSDSLTNVNISDVNISLISVIDPNISYNIKTDSLGQFSFEISSAGSYLVIINNVNYLEYSESIKITNSIYKIFKLKPTQLKTEEILVEEKKPLIELSGDKKIFNIDQTTLSKGGNALDVLRKIPMVEVDMNDNVKLRGNSNTKILIDNKTSKFSSLKQLSADIIKSVEIITNPSAKYEAEGVTGIINITLKESNVTGFNGNISLNGANKKRYSGSIGLNFRKDKTTIFTNGGSGIYEFKADNFSNIFYASNSSYNSIGNYKGENKYYYGWGGIEYKIVQDHIIGIESSISRYFWDNNGVNNNSEYNPFNVLLNRSNGSNTDDGNWSTNYASLYYTGKIDIKGHEIIAELSFNGDKYNWLSDINNQYFGQNDTLIYRSFKLLDQGEKNDKYNAQLDYTLPIGENKIEAGYKGIAMIVDNHSYEDTMDYFSGELIYNSNVSNNFKLKQFINAGYLTYSGKIKNFGFKAGIRLEYTKMYGEQLVGDYTLEKIYLNYFPTISLSYKIGMMNQISLNYSKRITRPMPYRLNPFVVKYNERTIFQGNPELNPEITDSYEASYLLLTPVITVTPSLFYRYTKDLISSYSYMIDSIVQYTTFRNGSWSKSFGLDLILSSNAFKWLNLNGSLSFYNTDVDNTSFSDEEIDEGFSWSANVRGFIKVSDLFNLELFYKYSGKKFISNGLTYPRHNFDAAISKTFFNNKLNTSIKMQDIFKTMEWKNETTGIGYSSVFVSNYDYRAVMLNVTYTFGNTEESISKSKKTKRNENENTDTREEPGR